MNLEMIFSGLNLLAIFGWIGLLLAPLNRPYVLNYARGIVLVLAVAYIAQLFLTTEHIEGGGFTSLAGVMALFTGPGNTMMGWTHYLAFDLFIGSWEVEDAAARGVPHWLVIPCLALTFLFGPIGLLLYFIIRTGWARFGKAASET
jgi:Domain of unknown function (DUF4281)